MSRRPSVSPTSQRLLAAALGLCLLGAACAEEGVTTLSSSLQVQGASTEGDALVVDFGEQAVGQAHPRDLVFENVGRVPAEVSLSTPQPPYSLVLPSPVVEPQQAVTATLTFAPQQEGPAQAQVEVGGLGGPVQLLLRGVGIVPPPVLPDAGVGTPCPRPAADCTFLATSTELWTFEPAGRALAFVGRFSRDDGQPLAPVTDVALDGQGRLYAVAEDLYRVDPETGVCHRLAPLVPGVRGLAALADGRLVAAGRDVRLLDADTGALRTVLVPEGHFDTAGDVVQVTPGALLWTVRGGLVRIELGSGAWKQIAAMPPEGVWGLAEVGGTCYGLTGTGRLLTLEPTTGAILSEATLPGEWNGAASAP